MSENRSLTYIELDISFCALRYGETTGAGTCPAVLGVDSVAKCYNSKATCPVRASYVEDTVTLRFGRDVAYRPQDIDCIPSLVAAEFSPGTIKPGESLGERASLTVTYRDGQHPDTGPGYDKYRTERAYDPVAQGTYWGKFRARQPYLRGQPIRLIHGKLGQALEDMETRHLFVESFTGPTLSGAFTIEAKDVFKQLDGDRAMAPEMSSGFLLADISAGDMSFTLSPAGIGNAEYAASGLVAIGGKEIVAFTRSGDTVTITARAQKNTEAQPHKAQDRVQTVLSFFGEDPAEIIRTLMVDYAGVDDGLIPIDEWLTETDGFLGTVYTADIAEPTAVRKLIDELIEQAALCVWWDDLAGQIRLTVLRSILTDAALFDEHKRVKDSPLGITDQPDKRVSQVWVYYAQINPLKALDDLDNFRSTQVTIDAEAETNNGTSAIRVVQSRWIPQNARAVAQRLANKLLARFRTAPRAFSFATMRYAGTDVELGRGYNIGAHVFQDAAGARVNVPVQVTRLVPAPDRFKVEAEEMRFEALDDDVPSHLVIIDVNSFNINLRTLHDSQYPEAESGDTVTCVVNAGVTVGSVSTALVAFDVGTWAAGVSVVLIVNGRIEGAGGRGADGVASFGSGNPGSAGGRALYARNAIDLDLSSGGQVWGGGGGGGSGGPFGTSVGSGGGGGGAGAVAGGSGGGAAGSAATGAAGAAGSATAGGAGGAGGDYLGSVAGSGGAGGGPGLSGGTGGTSGTGLTGGAGGAAGAAIDGISYVTLTLGAGDIRGSQIN